MSAPAPAPARHRGRPRNTDQPRGLISLDRLARKLPALYATAAATNGRRGDDITTSGTAPTPMRSAVVDARAHVERTLARLETIVTGVATGGDSVVRVSGWWGTILCPACGGDTLLLDLGEQRVMCTAEDCEDADETPWYDHEKWLEDQALGTATDGTPTIAERQRQRIETLGAEVARWRDQAADWRALYEQASVALAAYGLTDTSPAELSLGHGLHVCPETGAEQAS